MRDTCPPADLRRSKARGAPEECVRPREVACHGPGQHTVFVTTIRLLGYWRYELPEDEPREDERSVSDFEAALLRGTFGEVEAASIIAGSARDDELDREDNERDRAEMLQWPDVTWLVDPGWSEDERRRVGQYLQRGTRVNQMGGLSECRFCERHNGSAELTDGVYCWPEGLAHYVSEHDVRLPEEFVGHALSQPLFPPGLPQPSFDERGQRDRSWPGPSFAHLLWAPERPSRYGIVERDPSWWRQVTGIQGNA
jgi:hypothetical protein